MRLKYANFTRKKLPFIITIVITFAIVTACPYVIIHNTPLPVSPEPSTEIEPEVTFVEPALPEQEVACQEEFVELEEEEEKVEEEDNNAVQIDSISMPTQRPIWYYAYYDAIKDYNYIGWYQTTIALLDINDDGILEIWFYSAGEWFDYSEIGCLIDDKVYVTVRTYNISLRQSKETGEIAFYCSVHGNCVYNDFWLPNVHKLMFNNDGRAVFVPIFSFDLVPGYEHLKQKEWFSAYHDGTNNSKVLWFAISSDDIKGVGDSATDEQYQDFLDYAEGKLNCYRHNSDGTSTQLSVTQYNDEAESYLSNLDSVSLQNQLCLYDEEISVLIHEQIIDFLDKYI